MSEGNAEFLAHLEELGEAQVRQLMLNDGLPLSLQPITRKWLADKELESKRLEAASREEQIEIARSAKEAAWTAARAAERASSAAERQAVAAEHANTRATIALAIAIISIIATIIGIWLVHLDTVKAVSHLAYFSGALAFFGVAFAPSFALRLPIFISLCGFGGDVRARRSASFMRRAISSSVKS